LPAGNIVGALYCKL